MANSDSATFGLSAFGTRDGNNIRRINATVIIDAAAGFWSGLGFPVFVESEAYLDP